MTTNNQNPMTPQEQQTEIERLKHELSIKQLVIEDCCYTEGEIEKLVTPILGKEFVEGDTYCVPGALECVDQVCRGYFELEKENKELKRKVEVTNSLLKRLNDLVWAYYYRDKISNGIERVSSKTEELK